ncbi:ATP-binding protein [Pseudonocardia sp. WMMC193]|uniref:ATP-binding protein n=1 Tax=Pseudonocardia sp. WMMC193 TaxID=2911965 RepID=UPI001F34E601|nr:ATP-binding protein [Pseudonocardia sp. WMMC193]MCF7552498.1 ATP-binding protein [Pseudonocardia sp. WMMC193]
MEQGMDQEAAQAAAPHPPCGTVHEGVPFATPEQLAAELAEPLGAALEAGGPVVVAVEPDNRAALTAVLGTAASAVDWRELDEVHRVPPFTVATRWARLSRRTPRPEQRTTVVAQHSARLGLDLGHWARLDAALTVALAGLPVTMLCACPEDGDLDLLRATHPALRVGGASVPTDAVRDPLGVLAEFPPPPPPDLGPPVAELAFTQATLSAVRRLVTQVSPTAGLDPERVADLVLAVNEIATNSAEHGPGAGRLRLWGGAGRVVAEVYDVGRMDVAFPGLVAPPPSGERGRGLWLASELSDVLQVWSDAAGTTVRLVVETEAADGSAGAP